MRLLQKFDRNVAGRDFAVGDIHGSFHHLDRALRWLDFDPEKDRIFAVGDLVDRGRYNEHVEEWLDKPFFHSVLGNHEQMAMDYFAEPDALGYMYSQNGGGWFMLLNREDQERIVKRFAELPLAIEVDTPRGRVGIVHAEVPYGRWEWDDIGPRHVDQCLWNRTKIQMKDQRPVDGIDHVIVGHTPKRRVIQLGNVTYIDTGAVWGHHLTLVNLATGDEHRIGCYAN